MKTAVINNMKCEEKDNCYIFRGVPFASLSKRFSLPEGIKRYCEEVSALSFPPMMPQEEQKKGSFYQKEFHWFEKEKAEMDEFSLSLNMWVPKGEGPFPVAVYYHGGAFSHGSASEVEFDGEEWAKRGIILVLPQYRLGILGFIALEGEKCNLGLRDQMAAYDWVCDNISLFGGDRERISIMGQSAGGISVYSLLSSPYLKRRPFSCVMLSSGGIRGPIDILSIRRAEVEALTGEFLKEKTLDKDDLTSMPTEEIIRLGDEMIEYVKKRQKGISLLFEPLLDDDFLPLSLDEAIGARVYDDIPILMGAVMNDLSSRPLEMAENEMHLSECRFMERRKGKGYIYFFSHALPPDNTPSFHSADLWYIFGTLHRSWRGFKEDDWALSSSMIDAFSLFVRTGKAPWDEYPNVKIF